MRPNWLITRSNVPGANAWVWASATMNSTLSICAVRARSGRDLGQWRGDVDADRCVGDAGCGEGEGAAPAAHIEHRAMRCQPDQVEQRLGERRQLAVVAVGVVDVVHRLAPVPGVRLLLIRWHDGSSGRGTS